MKRLIKRYVLKAQVDRESDEVNEGENSLLLKAHTHCLVRVYVCAHCVNSVFAVMEFYQDCLLIYRRSA